MKSYYDLKYRAYVLSQFRMKKNKIEALIRKNQEELKILEETMENISDGNIMIKNLHLNLMTLKILK
jgi:hypothetical protein